MAAKNIGRLNLVIQDNEEPASIVPTAENFEKISEAFDDFYNRGLGDKAGLTTTIIKDTIDTFFKEGTYFFTNASAVSMSGFNDTSMKSLEVKYTSSPSGTYCVHRCKLLKNARTIERVYSSGKWGKWKLCNGYDERTFADPNGEWVYCLTDELFLNNPVYTTIIEFDFVSGGEIKFNNLYGLVIRHNGCLYRGVSCKTLPYIYDSYDNDKSAWITFKSLPAPEGGNIVMEMHGNNDGGIDKGLVQFWFTTDSEVVYEGARG